MTIKYQDSRVFTYEQEFIFNIIKNVADYKEFLPWCNNSFIDKNVDNSFIGTLELGLPQFNFTFMSDVVYQSYETVQANLRNSSNDLIKTLNCIWVLEKVEDNSTNVNFNIEMSLKYSFMEWQLKQYLKHLVNKLSNSFEKRAYFLYNKRSDIDNKLS